MARLPRKVPPRTKISTRRQAAGLSQARLAELTGLALRTVQRLDQGKAANPPIRYLANIALVLDCEISDIAEDEWLTWTVFDARADGLSR